MKKKLPFIIFILLFLLIIIISKNIFFNKETNETLIRKNFIKENKDKIIQYNQYKPESIDWKSSDIKEKTIVKIKKPTLDDYKDSFLTFKFDKNFKYPDKNLSFLIKNKEKYIKIFKTDKNHYLSSNKKFSEKDLDLWEGYYKKRETYLSNYKSKFMNFDENYNKTNHYQRYKDLYNFNENAKTKIIPKFNINWKNIKYDKKSKKNYVFYKKTKYFLTQEINNSKELYFFNSILKDKNSKILIIINENKENIIIGIVQKEKIIFSFWKYYFYDKLNKHIIEWLKNHYDVLFWKENESWRKQYKIKKERRSNNFFNYYNTLLNDFYSKNIDAAMN